ncbi:hypothetical protein EON65_32305 [archaeon]|nr:MAG: hypothetical protein EON65_32305 [archaeon]
MVGCYPPGPCCRWPGDPPGSCPAKGLFECELQKKVIGCTHHHPNYNVLKDPNIFSLTFMRNPISRAISAYGYGSIHYNSKCGQIDSPMCIKAYIHSNAFRNIAVKLFTGQYAYADIPTCRNTSTCPNSFELAISNIHHFRVIGLAELWSVSLLLLHSVFPGLEPLHYEFTIGSNATGSDQHGNVAKGLRIQSGKGDSSKSRMLLPYIQEIRQSNELDMELYSAVVDLLCKELISHNLWQYATVQREWRDKFQSKSRDGGCQ